MLLVDHPSILDYWTGRNVDKPTNNGIPLTKGDANDTNPIQRVNNLHGALLICHGHADDNVHPQNAYEYTEALVQADKDFKMNIYTNRNHSIYGGNTRNHLLRQIAQFFNEQLKQK